MDKTDSYKSRRSFVKKLGASLTFIVLGNGLSCTGSSSNSDNDSKDNGDGDSDIIPSTKEWQREVSMPYKLQEIYCSVLNNKIHLAGGFIDNNGIIGVSSNHIVFDPKANIWKSMAPIPEPRHHLQIVSHQGKLYAFGGFKAKSENQLWMMEEQAWKFDYANDSWEVMNSAPKKNAEAVSASLGDFIHIVGGRQPKGSPNSEYQDHEDTNSHLVYDAASNSWDSAAPALSKRNSAAGAVINGLFYVAGGRTMSGNNVPSLEIYDPKEDKWRSGSPMPQGQAGLAAATIGGKLYAFGGEYFDNGRGVFKECWSYNPESDQWSASVPMLTPRHGLGAATVGTKIYAIGGAIKAGALQTSKLLESIQF